MKTLSDFAHTAFILKIERCSENQIIERLTADIMENDKELHPYKAKQIAKILAK